MLCQILLAFRSKLRYNAFMKKIIVTEKYNRKKLTTFLLDSFSNLSQNTLYKSLRKKDIRINGKRINENIEVHTGDEVTIFIPDDLLFGTFPNLQIVYEDENILVINKPSGICVTENASSEITLTSLVKKQFGNSLEPCHRLDRNTTGLLLYAKNQEALNVLLQKFKNYEIEKHYLATVLGIPIKKHDILTAYLFKDSKKSLVYISDQPQKNYVEIVTEYTVISENLETNTCELDVVLHTGKTHQIRAHLAHIGYPIIGDGKYGNNQTNKKFKKSTQMLCSYKLKFNFTTKSNRLAYLNGKEIILY